MSLKLYKKLFQKKYRLQYGLAIAEGKNAVEALVNFFGFTIEEICISETLKLEKEFSFLNNTEKTNETQNIKISYYPGEELERVSKNSGGIFAVFDFKLVSEKLKKQFTETAKHKQKRTVIILHSISDPGNLGTIIRAANAFWADAVFIAEKGVDEFNEKVIRSSAGSIFKIPVLRGEYSKIVKTLKEEGFTLLATSVSETAKKLTESDLHCEKTAFIFGNEAHGLTPEEILLADAEIFIPISENVESLNLASAVSSILALKTFCKSAIN
ncbi:MAG: RNA methyltransferase [Bifidobacteriaceae bacterium]|nr:RNA methyltransferase [Bifidobacteriaceae bacterium]